MNASLLFLYQLLLVGIRGYGSIPYPDAAPPVLGAPVSPPAMVRAEVLNDAREAVRVALVRDWRNIAFDFWVGFNWEWRSYMLDWTISKWSGRQTLMFSLAGFRSRDHPFLAGNHAQRLHYALVTRIRVISLKTVLISTTASFIVSEFFGLSFRHGYPQARPLRLQRKCVIRPLEEKEISCMWGEICFSPTILRIMIQCMHHHGQVQYQFSLCRISLQERQFSIRICFMPSQKYSIPSYPAFSLQSLTKRNILTTSTSNLK